MKKRQIETVLFSAVGLVVMAVLLIAINAIFSGLRLRADVTEDKLYTLSDGTKEILTEVQEAGTPIEIRFYATQDRDIMPAPLATYAARVEDFLAEYKQHAGGAIGIEKFNPKPDSDAEDSARMDGLQGQPGPTGQPVYLGLVVSMLDRKEVIPFLSPQNEALLEYEISRAIDNVMTDEKPVVGVYSSLSIFGQQMPPQMMRQMGQQGQEPWLFVEQLRRDFEVRELSQGLNEIPSDLDVLVLVHPSGLSAREEYAIDQYVLSGGKLVAFLDPMAISQQSGGPMQQGQQGASNLPQLLSAWGYELSTDQVVADLNFTTRVGRGRQNERNPAILSVTRQGIHEGDVLTADIDNLVLPFAGAFEGEPAEGIEETALLTTTEQSQLVDKFQAQFGGGNQLMGELEPSGRKQKLALRLQGTFPSAFPDGRPESEAEEPAAADAGNDGGDAGPSDEHRTEGRNQGVLLVADSDFLADQFVADVRSMLGQRIVRLRGGNLPLAQAAVEQLAGNEALIAVRSRGTMTRPFTRIREMEARAQDEYRDELQRVDQSLEEVRSSLQELQAVKQQGDQVVLPPEQRRKLQEFQQQQAQLRERRTELRRQLRADVEALQRRVQWINIAGMPALVTLIGLVFAVIKRKRTAAK